MTFALKFARFRRVLAALLAFASRAQALEPSLSISPADLLAPFFHPPPEYAERGARFRSPLLFDDGTLVASAADWPRRRTQIYRYWMETLGPWPPLITNQPLQVLTEAVRGTVVQRRVRWATAPGQWGESWLEIPPGKGPFPAVIVCYYEPETSVGLNPKQPQRDFGWQLAQRGFVTLSLGTPGGNAWKPDLAGASCQPLSFHAYVAANGWLALAQLPEVDRSRIAIMGHSYGGKWALFAAALWDRFAAVAVSDPGVVFDEARSNVNYWEPWYLGQDSVHPRAKPGPPALENPRTGAYRELVEHGRDLTDVHALIAPRPFLVSGGAEDPPERWTALNHAVAVNQLLGFTNLIALTRRPDHTPTDQSNAELQAFFVHFLQRPLPGAQPQ